MCNGSPFLLFKIPIKNHNYRFYNFNLSAMESVFLLRLFIIYLSNNILRDSTVSFDFN